MLLRIIALFISLIITFPSALIAQGKEEKVIKLPWTFEAKMDFIWDGDSVRVWSKENKLMVMISLFGIDSPELTQPFGSEVKEFLKREFSKKKKFKVTLLKLGKFNVGYGYINIDGKDLGLMLVKNGLAKVDRFPGNAFTDPEEKKMYMEAEEKARKNKTGIWSIVKDHESFGDFRKRPKAGKKH